MKIFVDVTHSNLIVTGSVNISFKFFHKKGFFRKSVNSLFLTA